MSEPVSPVSIDYRAGWNAALDRAMQILHIRCCTLFDPELKREKLAECRHPVFELGGACVDCGEMVGQRVVEKESAA